MIVLQRANLIKYFGGTNISVLAANLNKLMPGESYKIVGKRNQILQWVVLLA